MFSTASIDAKYVTEEERTQLPTNAAFDELVSARCNLQFEGQDVIALIYC